MLNDVIRVAVGGEINHLTSLAMAEKADTILKGVHTATVRYLLNCLIAVLPALPRMFRNICSRRGPLAWMFS